LGLGGTGDGELVVGPRQRCEAEAACAAAGVADRTGCPCVVGEPVVACWACHHGGAARARLVSCTCEERLLGGLLDAGAVRCLADGVAGGEPPDSHQPPEYSRR
jgi:hypothetical protein